MRSTVGHFVDDVGWADFLRAYRAGMAQLPAFDAQTGVTTTFGSVRVYRFDGPSVATPVLLLPGRNASTPMWRANLAPILATLSAPSTAWTCWARPGSACRSARSRAPMNRRSGSPKRSRSSG